MSLIELERLHKNYWRGSTSVAALRGIDLRIESGELVAFQGPSGSGKTTLANLIGLLDKPTAGRLLLDGRDLSGSSDGERCRLRNSAMGFVFQRFNLLPVLTALENVALPLEIQGCAPKESRERARERLREMRMEELMTARPTTLSAGEQQRVAIARALVTEPLVVLADEPTANLDSATARSIVDLIRRMNRERGTTFLLFTHDDRLIQSTERRVALLDGVVVGDESAAR